MKKILSFGLIVFALSFLSACGGGGSSSSGSGPSAHSYSGNVEITCADIVAQGGVCSGQPVNGLIEGRAGLVLNSPAIYNAGNITLGTSVFLVMNVLNDTPATVKAFAGAECFINGTGGVAQGIYSAPFSMAPGQAFSPLSGTGVDPYVAANLGPGYCNITVYNGALFDPSQIPGRYPPSTAALATAQVQWTSVQ